MTTICYNHKDKEIAADGRVTRGSLICTDTKNKIVKRNDGLIFAYAGSSSDIEDCINRYPDRPSKEVNCYGFMVKDGVAHWVSYSDGVVLTSVLDHNESCGSGQDHALTAMDMGLSAKDALKMAMKRDSSTGGRIRVFKVGD